VFYAVNCNVCGDCIIQFDPFIFCSKLVDGESMTFNYIRMGIRPFRKICASHHTGSRKEFNNQVHVESDW